MYLAVNKSWNENGKEGWFRREKLGENAIDSLIRNASAKAGIDKKLTNHSARKYLVSTLLNEGVPDTKIIQITGHSGVSGLVPYTKINHQDHEKNSKVLLPNIAENKKRREEFHVEEEVMEIECSQYQLHRRKEVLKDLENLHEMQFKQWIAVQKLF